MNARGSAHNGGPGLPDLERKNFEMMAVYETQQNIFTLP